MAYLKQIFLLIFSLFALTGGGEEALPMPVPTTPPPVMTEAPAPVETPAPPTEEGKIIVIDPGHQGKGNSALEPIGPGASEKKPKVATGTQGRATGVPEYEVTLAVSLKLKDELEARGYTVIMVRESHDVDISNRERADIANEAKADAFVRIHCNGDNNTSVAGALTMCSTAGNPYPVRSVYRESRSLSEQVLAGLVEATGARNRGVLEVDNMSGINWCTVPVTIVEMGFMTNADEDKKLVDDGYQNKLAAGIADGIDGYFGS